MDNINEEKNEGTIRKQYQNHPLINISQLGKTNVHL